MINSRQALQLTRSISLCLPTVFSFSEKAQMASSPLMGSTAVLMLLLTIFSSLQLSTVSSFEFQVGGIEGWVVPHANDSKLYNDWASENRFQVGDSVRFRYKKDSVMVVSEADYKRCNSTHPIFFSNTGNTVYHFDHSGPYYFISGVAEHCQRGQRMIVKVMASENSSGGGTSSTSSAATLSLSLGGSKLVIFQFLLSSVAAYLF